MPRLSPAVLALSLIAAMAATPAAANPAAFVVSTGSDANTASGCGPTTPCRSFAAAHSVVDPGGLILALDAAGYGIVTITKSVTIAASPGFYARMGNSTGSVITINTPGVIVTLRGLNIDSAGATYGVNMTNGAKLSIENCVISNFTGGQGVYVNTAAEVRIVDSLIRDNNVGVYIQGDAEAAISGSKILGNSTAGLLVYGNAANARPTVSVTDSILTHNNVAVHAFETINTALVRIWVIRSTLAHNTYGLRSQFSGGPTVISVSESLVVGNTTQLAQEGAGATLNSFGNNTVQQGSNVGTISAVTLQ